ncbi:MAG TPA: hypothetical protein VN152_13245 [Sphingopyxis sp.]|nr:hypothetical protein [Sphingopyxis sp.]
MLDILRHTLFFPVISSMRGHHLVVRASAARTYSLTGNQGVDTMAHFNDVFPEIAA